tara:strand:+ start:353 stop:595 length:243 start_codon:yes stop_codon:yes gene_type:complete
MTKKLNLSFSVELSEDIDESQVLDALLEIIPSIREHLDSTDINLDLAEETATVASPNEEYQAPDSNDLWDNVTPGFEWWS